MRIHSQAPRLLESRCLSDPSNESNPHTLARLVPLSSIAHPYDTRGPPETFNMTDEKAPEALHPLKRQFLQPDLQGATPRGARRDIGA